MIVFLIGFMGCGKTTTGKKLAKKLGYNFIDLDQEIEKQEQVSIDEIFESKGESYFRNLEHQKLLTFLQSKNLVISCGGGTPCFNNNMDLMNKSGYTIYIQMNAEALFIRLKQAKTPRPLLKNLNEEDLKTYINHKLKEREQFYLSSALIIDGIKLDMKGLTENVIKKQSLFS
jgi:shikimate kinase